MSSNGEEYRHYSDRERMVHRLKAMRTELERESKYLGMDPGYVKSLDSRIERLERLNEAHLRRLRANRRAEQQLHEEAHEDRATQ